jgi:hypothetical protein
MLRRARRRSGLLGVAAIAPLLMAQCAPSCAPSAAVPGAPVYGNGSYAVNQNFVPGLYFSESGARCYWERLSGLGGTIGEVIVNDYSSGQHVVAVAPTDAGFRSEGCGNWTQFAPPVSPRLIGDGDWHVANQMGANLWVAKPTAFCSWTRASSFSHRDDTLANDFSNGKQLIVQTLPTDLRFSSSGCGTWLPFNPATAPVPIFDGDWDVARQMGGGRWQANAPGECAWQRAAGFTHDPGEVIAEGAVAGGPVVVDVAQSDARFTSNGCGVWTRIG